MVLITDDRDGGGALSVRVKQLQQQQQQKVAGNVIQIHPSVAEEPLSSSDEDYLGSSHGEEDDEEEEEDDDGGGEEEDDNDFEEVDFEDLEDCRSITSDDSFYPPDDVFADSERTPSPESPQPLSFFQACCTNNAAIVRIMIRHGVKEEDVKEKDRNNRVGAAEIRAVKEATMARCEATFFLTSSLRGGRSSYPSLSGESIRNRCVFRGSQFVVNKFSSEFSNFKSSRCRAASAPATEKKSAVQCSFHLIIDS